VPSSEKGSRTVIGLAALAGAVTLLYFAARPSLDCVSRPPTGIDCSVTARVANLVTIDESHVSGVTAVAMVASATGRSRTPPRLTFVTASGNVDLGYFSQLFTRDFAALEAFVANPEPPELRLVQRVTIRTFAAHLGVLFLFVVGLGPLVTAIRR
jgi:hypothetical protein